MNHGQKEGGLRNAREREGGGQEELHADGEEGVGM